MTPVPFELPLKASEAAAIAELIYQSNGEAKRFAARLGGLSTPSVRVYPSTLAADPIHPASYFVVVDGLAHDRVTPLLLRVAPASSPGSGLFPKSLLIGRMRPADMREVVVNAIAFGREDEEAIRTFAEKVDKAYLPRVAGAMTGPLRVVETEAEGWAEALWNEIRRGNREGWILGLKPVFESLEGSREVVERAWAFTRYSVSGAIGLEAAAEIYDHIRRVKMGVTAPWPRTFEFEVRENPVLATALRASGRATSSR